MTASSLTRLSTGELRRSGREPATPFLVRGADGEDIAVARLLRVLPGKRLSGEARWRGRHVLAKLFVAEDGGRHWARERRGLDLLRKAGLPTPEEVGAGRLDGGGHFLLTEFIAASRTLDDEWRAKNPPPDGARAQLLLHPAFALLGRLHAAGLVHTDPHPGNFLEHAGRLFLLDGDGVERARSEKQLRDNLALLIAQLPPAWECHIDPLLAAYAPGRMSLPPERETLRRAAGKARARRLAHFLDKTLRDCSPFAVRHTARLFSSFVRAEEAALAPFLGTPEALDEAIAQGQLLNDGHTCTVARIEAPHPGEARALVIKRYNLKNLGHALSRGWRPSRAWHSWLAGHRLAFHGLSTPAPLALVEERIGPLRRRAFLITEFCPGETLLRHLSPERPPDVAEAAAIGALFETLFRLKITHGDMKATNFLWHERRLVLIDLDTLTPHWSDAAFARGWRRDRARFLCNWPADSVLHRWLDAHLPEAG